jgi:hypothetical protein
VNEVIAGVAIGIGRVIVVLLFMVPGAVFWLLLQRRFRSLQRFRLLEQPIVWFLTTLIGIAIYNAIRDWL